MSEPSAKNCSCPNYIHPKHYQEWKDSCVDEGIINLNVRSLHKTTPYEDLLYGLNTSERRNDGRLRDKWMNRYSHLWDGGWWCGTVDPLTGEYGQWGCFKPDNPKIDREKRKTIKYETPPKVPTEAFFLKVPYRVGLKIAKKHGLETEYSQRLIGQSLDSEDGEFWTWVKNSPEIALLITEGAKKAGTLLTAGYCAVALPGIWNGYRQPKDELGNKIGLPHLIPQLEPFATEGREIPFCFDHDTNFQTILNVQKAISLTGKLLKKKGCKVNVIQWTDPYKGVDDLLSNKGEEYFQTIYDERITLSEFSCRQFLYLKADLTINERFFPDSLEVPGDARLIALKGYKGTGKTEYIARKIQSLLDKGQKVIIIGHREQLMIELARRFAVDYRTELRTSETGGIFGYALCIDSLHSKANPSFNPKDWEGATVVIDEVEQVIWHVLNGDTCRANRVRILKTLKELLQMVVSTGGRVWIADADLTSISLEYIQKLINFPVKTYVIENIYRLENRRKCYWYDSNSPATFIEDMAQAVQKGDKVVLFTDGQKHKSTFGTRRLEDKLRKRFPHRKILRIDRESVANSKHPAFGCMGNLNKVLPNYDIVLCSPTVETGVSIDVKYFDSVWGISHGLQTIESFCQALERVRDDVPRYIWVKEWSDNKVGHGEADLKSLLRTTHTLTKGNVKLLQDAGINEFDDLGFVENEFTSSPSLNAWAKRACVVNCQAQNFRKNLIKKLTADGYTLESIEPDILLEQKFKQENKAESKEFYAQYCYEIVSTPNPSDAEYSQLKEQRSRTEDELNKVKKGKLCRRYLTESIDPDLIEKDDEGFYSQILLHYFLTIGNCFLNEREVRALQEIKEQGEGKAFKPDVNRSQMSLRVHTVKRIGVEKFFEPNSEHTGESLREWFDQLNNPMTAYQLNAILGVKISPKDTPIAFTQRLLDKLLGLKLRFVGWERGKDGKARRVYQGCDIHEDGRQAIFSRWFQRDSFGVENVAQ